MADEPVDTRNKFWVGVGGQDEIVLLNPPPERFSREDALNLAAWIVALADRGGRFAEVLQAVRET
jgi:hypothetical protein